MPSSRYILTLAFALALTAQTLPAQFTTVVVPPPREQRPSVPRYVFRDSSQDTSTARRLAEMSAWVDSAAVAMGIQPIEAESLAATVPADTTTPERVAEVPADTTGGPPADSLHPPDPTIRAPDEFKEGAPAPDTATPFPMLTLLGASLIGAGMWLRRR
jgi:hypothetical protein